MLDQISLSTVLNLGKIGYQALKGVLDHRKRIKELTKYYGFQDYGFNVEDFFTLFWFLGYLKYIRSEMVKSTRAPDRVPKISYSKLKDICYPLLKDMMRKAYIDYSNNDIDSIFGKLEEITKGQKEADRGEVTKFCSKIFNYLEKSDVIYEVEAFGLSRSDLQSVSKFIWTILGKEYLEIWSTQRIADEKVTRDLARGDNLRYFVTLGGAWLLDESQNWPELFKNLNNFVMFIQHPFQPKVVCEVLNGENVRYPSEMIRNWMEMKPTLEEGNNRVIWCREPFPPVSNLEQKSPNHKVLWLERYDQTLRTNTTGAWIKVDSATPYEFIIDREDRPFFKKLSKNYGDYVDFTGLGIDTFFIEDMSNVEALVESYLGRQMVIEEIMSSDSNETFINSVFKINLLNSNNYWERLESFGKKPLLMDSKRWVGLGLLNLILLELTCACILLEVLDYYIISGRGDQHFKEGCRLSLEAIRELLEGGNSLQGYLTEIRRFISNLDLLLNVPLPSEKALEEISSMRDRINKRVEQINKLIK